MVSCLEPVSRVSKTVQSLVQIKSQNGFKGVKLKSCLFLQLFFTSCEHDCFCLRTLKHFRFKCLRQCLKIIILIFWNRFWGSETSFKKFTTYSIDRLLFFVKIETIKAKKNHINISHEKDKYKDSCFEESDGWTKWDK